MAHGTRERAGRSHSCAFSQRCVLGQRNQDVAATRFYWLSGLYAQRSDRCFLSGMCTLPTE
ncbi:Uncharacterised protein [Vibrio cholerae]|nr:Uncharacterised protein [Vibrio cholerae]CSI33083.1 Uncharacterised protein [Vibrio cholerae]CSI49870.1 Uncharacterised protein [Vibrio cholerae]